MIALVQGLSADDLKRYLTNIHESSNEIASDPEALMLVHSQLLNRAQGEGKKVAA